MAAKFKKAGTADEKEPGFKDRGNFKDKGGDTKKPASKSSEDRARDRYAKKG